MEFTVTWNDSELYKRIKGRSKMKQSYKCACEWDRHVLVIEQDDDYLLVSVINAPANYSLRKRIKAAWDILCGKEHSLSDIVLTNEEARRLYNYLHMLYGGSKTEGVTTIKVDGQATSGGAVSTLKITN